MNTWIVIPDIISGLYPRLMPELGKPIRAKKYPQKNKNMTFYLVSVHDPEEGRDKKIVIRAPECWEAEVTVQVRRKTGSGKNTPDHAAGIARDANRAVGLPAKRGLPMRLNGTRATTSAPRSST